MRGAHIFVALAALVALATVTLSTTPAAAKETALRTPSGRTIYGPEETFEGAVDQRTRLLIIELATGLATEGNLAVGLGLLVPRAGGLELWAHFGLEANPSLRYSGGARYVFAFGAFRPYLAAGFTFADLYAQGSLSTHLFAEVGHQFVVFTTYRISLGVGFRGVLNVWLKGNSPHLDGTTDPVWVQEQLDSSRGFFPTLALRFSRAF
jgi:hypothetical protein